MSISHEADWKDLGEFVSKVMAEKCVPGVAVGISYRGERAAAGFGVTNVDHPLPVTDKTLFQIGSITKTFTGTAIMQLIEKGKLDLNATVRTYLPNFKVADEEAASQATIRHLLTHMSGWVGDFFDDTGAGDDALAKYMANMAGLEQLAPIGTVWSYNNAGFYLAGYIIEKVTGKSYQTALKELVLEPLGLKSSYFDAGDVITHRFAVGHNVSEAGTPQVARPWPLPRAAYPAGGITCHVLDLLRYAQFHLGDGSTENGTRLLSAESITQMQSPQVSVWGNETWGLTWGINEFDGTRQISHGGGTIGQISLLILIPAHKFAIAILTNANRGGVVTRDVSRWALKKYLGLEITDPTPIESSEEELTPYVGRYSRPLASIELGILGGRLVAQIVYKRGFPAKDSLPPPAPPPASLFRYEKDRLLVGNGPLKDAKVDVVRKPDGTIGWLRLGGRIHVREG
ncbi:beta-lactamase family protein [Candidatus Acetothermia bacterium]|nr:beta-lactamase family protein [Candidatus Acetothermia bacterium]